MRWLAVPEDEDGMWFADPIGAETESDVRKLATEQWSGKLPEHVDVVIYCCDGVDVLTLPKEGEPARPIGLEAVERVARKH